MKEWGHKNDSEMIIDGEKIWDGLSVVKDGNSVSTDENVPHLRRKTGTVVSQLASTFISID